MAETAILNGKPRTNDDFDIVVLKFADSKIPEFKEVKSKDYILYGENNDYPEYLTYLYNKSAKHNAIINGKCNYILGSGFDRKTQAPGGFADFKNPDGTITPAAVVNKSGETMYDIWVKSVKDIEIYGGFRWLVSWNLLNQITDIYHDDFYKFRLGKDGNYYYKKCWVKDGKTTREDPTIYPEFNPDPLPPGPNGQAVSKGIQVFAYNEYRPGCDYYPLPGYIGCNNYIDTDIEISKFHLSSIRNGMMPSKLIQFYTGEPTDEKKKEVEKRFEKKFGGAENAGKFVLVFNTNKDKSVDISDLSASELDKQFDILNRTCQQEIFTGHQVVSPMLFGIKTEGQLGGNTELKTAYEVFINTYAKSKQANIERIVNYFGGLMGKGKDYFISQLDPVGLMFDVKDIVNLLPKEFIYEKLGIPKEYMGLPPVNPNNPVSGPANVQQEQAVVNDNIKNLTAKQHQQLVRIIREYSKGKITPDAAKVLLKTGLALSDEEINSLLGIDEDAQAFSADSDTTIEMFAACGDLKKDFHIVKSKAIKFSSNKEAVEDELNFYQQAFKAELTNTEASILDLIKKDKRITPEIIAETIGATPEYVTAKIASLTKKGVITSKTETIGDDKQVERTVAKDIKPPTGEVETTEIFIKYSYEVKPGIGPAIIETTRPFCKKLIELDRLYSRTEIESISQRLGYSVWDRRGGWWGDSPTCRHMWVSHVVVKKGKK